MKINKAISKILIAAALVVVMGGLTFLLAAANKKDEARLCSGVNIRIESSSAIRYVEKDEVLFAIEKENKSALLHQPVDKINLAKLESVLENEHWIKDAQLYFDSKSMLNVLVKERTPIARIITTEGNSFYIDDEGKQLPLMEDKVVRLQTVTGFPAAKKWNRNDSAVFNNLKAILHFIAADDFWNAQVGQIDIAPNKNIELIPVIGDHVIKVGTGENIEEKLSRLMLFYKQVLTKVGFSKYASIDVRFNGQIVAAKKQTPSTVDSIAFRQKVDALINKVPNLDELQPDQNLPSEKLSSEQTQTVGAAIQNNSREKLSVSVKTHPNPTVTKASNPNPLKANTNKSTPVENDGEQQPPKPKAVMPAKAEKIE